MLCYISYSTQAYTYLLVTVKGLVPYTIYTVVLNTKMRIKTYQTVLNNRCVIKKSNRMECD